MSSVTAKRTLLSTKAKAFSIASLVEQGNEAECGQVDDNMVKEPSEEGAPCPSSSKKRKLLSYEAVEEKRKPQAILEGRELWECFYRLGTEMIITKSGRRMFPPLRVSFTGLDPNQTYAVVLDVVPLDNKRHRYSYTDSAWFVAGEADPTPPRRVYTHPESPFTGEELARQVLSFERVKLTNNPKDSNGNPFLVFFAIVCQFVHVVSSLDEGHSQATQFLQAIPKCSPVRIILNSMHKYQPRVHLIKNPSETNCEQDLDKSDSFIFPETAFMAVTAYQNHLITRLKIYSNPFAKGFRDTTRLLPSFEEDGYVIQSDDFSRCCDTRDSMCCHLSGQLSCYSHDTRDTTDHRIFSSQDTRWACTDECCHGAEYPWRPAHGYARSVDFYSSDGPPCALLNCSSALTEERLRDY